MTIECPDYPGFRVFEEELKAPEPIPAAPVVQLPIIDTPVVVDDAEGIEPNEINNPEDEAEGIEPAVHKSEDPLPEEPIPEEPIPEEVLDAPADDTADPLAGIEEAVKDTNDEEGEENEINEEAKPEVKEPEVIVPQIRKFERPVNVKAQVKLPAKRQILKTYKIKESTNGKKVILHNILFPIDVLGEKVRFNSKQMVLNTVENLFEYQQYMFSEFRAVLNELKKLEI